jgi:hypothetical protein
MIANVALMTMALLPLSMRRHLCHCQAGVNAFVTIALLPLICNGVVALVAMASLPSSSWCCFSSLQWRCCYHPQASLPSSPWHCCPCCNGIVAVDSQASLPLLRWKLSPLLQ